MREDASLDPWARAGAAASGLAPADKKIQPSPMILELQFWYIRVLEKIGRFKPDPAPDWLRNGEGRIGDGLSARLAVELGRALAQRANALELAAAYGGGGGGGASRYLDDFVEFCGNNPPRFPFPIGGGGWKMGPAELLLIAGQLHAAATLSGSAALQAGAQKIAGMAAR